jgi:hypothetical protein
MTFDRATALGDPVGGKFLRTWATNDYTGSTTVNGKSGATPFFNSALPMRCRLGTTLTL